MNAGDSARKNVQTSFGGWETFRRHLAGGKAGDGSAGGQNECEDTGGGRRAGGRAGGRTDERAGRRADGRTGGRADGLASGRTDGTTDGRTDGRTLLPY